MIDGALIFLGGVICGAPLWISLAWSRFLRYESPPVQVTVTPEVLHQVGSQMVMQWLEANGYVWMPKGKEFKWPHEVRR
jgi:hypothetical protein